MPDKMTRLSLALILLFIAPDVWGQGSGIMAPDNWIAGKPDDYKKGFCDGFNQAAKASQDNRDRFMKMNNDFPFETLEQSYNRMHSSKWEDLHKDGNVVHRAITIERDAVDLYVVLPLGELKCD